VTTGRRLVLLGGSGQVGTALRRLAARNDWQVDAPGRAALDIGAAFADDDIPDADIIVNAAAYTAVDRAETDRDAAMRINADGPGRLAGICARRGVPLIHLSTDYVFDGRGSAPLTEDVPVAPASAYGRTKADGEAAVRAAHDRHVILRTAWVFGPDGSNFLRTILRLADRGAPMRIVADQTGGPTPADAVAGAVLRMADMLAAHQDEASGLWGTYHFAGAPATTWHGFAAGILDRLRAGGAPVPPLIPITTAEYPTPAQRPAWSVLDCSKIETTFGIRQPDWRAGIVRALDRLRSPDGSPGGQTDAPISR